MIDLAAIRHWQQYGGLWACLPERMQLAIARVRRMDLAAHIQASQASLADGLFPSPAPDVSIEEDGVVVLRLLGELTKYPSSLNDCASMVELRGVMRAIGDDPNVAGAMLVFDSPGGTVAGTAELAAEIAAAARKKQVMAYAEDLCASAAYWCASAAGALWCNAGAFVGSVGTYSVIADYSAAFDAQGVKIQVVHAGTYKGMLVPGTEVSPAQISEVQRIIDDTNALFVAAVAAGRHMSLDVVNDLADGRVHIGEKALALGLVDGVCTFDEAMAKLRTQIPGSGGAHALGGGGKSLARYLHARMPAVPVRAALPESPHHGPSVGAEHGRRHDFQASAPSAPPLPTAKDFARASELRLKHSHPLALREADITRAMDLGMSPAQALDCRNGHTPATMEELLAVFSAKSEYLAECLKKNGGEERKRLEGYVRQGLSIIEALEQEQRDELASQWHPHRKRH